MNQRVPATIVRINVSLFCALFLLFIPPITSQAQAPITASGLNTQISGPIPVGGKTQYNITGGTRPGGGTNLFHSFGDFNVPTNNIANFLNDSGLPTSNILGRVTLGNPSVIFGTIQTNGPGGFGNANLFLMNPAGFLFGPNATLNMGGMVAFTTANYLRFQGADTLFNNASTPGSLSPLSIAPVAAFGFLGSNPSAIAIQGSTLTVAEGLSLVGGTKGFTATDPDNGNPIHVPDGITMTGGKLSAPGGQINIASVAGAGEISAVDFMPTPGMTMGNVSLSQGALLDVSADAAGTVRIRGGQLVMNDATISADTVNSKGAPTAVDINITGDLSITDTMGVPAITARTTGTGDAGAVQIASGNLTATTTFVDPLFAFKTLIDTSTAGSGAAGNVNIVTGNLTTNVQPNAQFAFIDSGTKSSGHGGDISITAADIDLNRTFLSTGDFIARFNLPDSSGVTGSAGNLTITANSLRFFSGGITTEAFASFPDVMTQKGGDVTLNVKTIDLLGAQIGMTATEGGGVLAVNADTFHMDSTFFETATVAGPGGNVAINARTVELINGSQIISTTLGDGKAGDVIINATDHVSLIGGTERNGLNAPTPSGIFSNSTGEFGSHGDAGNVVVNTTSLEMVGGRINTVSASSGSGGNVTIRASGSISISGEFQGTPEQVEGTIFDVGPLAPSGVVTQTIGRDFCSGTCGNAGRISITTGSLTMGSGAQINSGTSNNGRGGDITVSVTGPVSIAGTLTDASPVGIFSRTIGTTPDAGGGGNISLIAGQSVSISNGASVSASTTGPGNAGNILVKANDISITGGGTITAASTGAGNAGTVTIEGSNSPANSFLIDGAGSGVFTNTENTGAGGSISVDANAVTIQNGGTISASTSGTSSSAIGGNISISGGQFVQLNNGTSITASSSGPGNTGNIQINAGNQFAMTNSSVTTEASQSGGGLIKITTNPNGTVQLTNSMISASVLDGNGGGGSVNIDPQFVILQNSQVLANAVFGPGGNIFITTNLLLPDTLSLISASSRFGQQGTIIIQSPISPASGKIVPLGQKPLLATTLLSQRCAALAGGNISSFTVAGRDSLPAEPGGWVSTPLALSLSESEDGAVKEAGLDRTPSETAEEIPVLSLRKIAPPGFLIDSFAVDSLAGCAS